MGSPNGQPDAIGNLVHVPFTIACESQGDVRNLVSLIELQEPDAREDDHGSIRQQNGSSIRTQTGRNEILNSKQSSQDIIIARSSVTNSSSFILPSRAIQLPSRQTVERIASKGFASFESLNKESLSELGNSSNRLILHELIQSGSKICFDRCQRSRGVLCRCLPKNIKSKNSLGGSSPLLNTRSSSTPEDGKRDISSCGTSVGEDILENRFEE